MMDTEAHKTDLPNIGDSISGIVTEIEAHPRHRTGRRVHLDVGIPGVNTMVQSTVREDDQVRMMAVGDSVDGWVLRANWRAQSLNVTISDLGILPPTEPQTRRYISAIKSVGSYLATLSSETDPELPDPDAISEVRGLLTRCIKKDQLDWLFVYRAFGAENISQIRRIRDRYLEFQRQTRRYRRGAVPRTDCDQIARRLIDTGFVPILAQALERIEQQLDEWQTAKTELIVKEPGITFQHSSSINTVEEQVSQFDTQNVSAPRTMMTQVKLERANAIHEELLNQAAGLLRAKNVVPRCSNLVDLFAHVGDSTVVVEVKSLTPRNERSQLRKAFAQLHEYVFLHKFDNPKRVILTNEPPADSWLTDFLVKDQGISFGWRDDDSFRFVDGSDETATELFGEQT